MTTPYLIADLKKDELGAASNHGRRSFMGSLALFLHAPRKTGVANAHLLSELLECDAAAIKNHHDVIPLVPSLLETVRPSTVSGLIPASVVNSIQRRSRRSLAHVPQERSKIGRPRCAHIDSAPAVIGVGRIARIGAAPLGGSPRAELWRHRTAARESMNDPSSGLRSAQHAPAASGKASLQAGRPDLSSLATVAGQSPKRALAAIGRPARRNEHSKPLSGEVM